MSGDSIPLAVNRDSGFIPDPFDAKDHYYQAEDSTRPQLSVNLRKTHAPDVSGVYNQGQTGSCTANAVAAAFWYEEKAGRRAKVWGSAGPSRLFIYWNARGGYKNDNHDIKHVSDKGSQGRAAIKGLAKVGACSEADCPFVDFDGIKSKLKKTKLKGNALDEAVEEEIKKAVNTKPSDNAFRNATPHKITSYYRLDPQRPDKDVKSLTKEQKDKIGSSLLENLRKCLTEGFPVTFGFWFYLPDDDAFDTAKKPFVLRDVWHRGVDSFPRHTFPQDLPRSGVSRTRTASVKNRDTASSRSATTTSDSRSWCKTPGERTGAGTGPSGCLMPGSRTLPPRTISGRFGRLRIPRIRNRSFGKRFNKRFWRGLDVTGVRDGEAGCGGISLVFGHEVMLRISTSIKIDAFRYFFYT